jgi:hypothetical protein
MKKLNVILALMTFLGTTGLAMARGFDGDRDVSNRHPAYCWNDGHRRVDRDDSQFHRRNNQDFDRHGFSRNDDRDHQERF